MPGFQFRDKDKERWAAAAAAAVSAAALTVRKRMAAGIGSGKLPAAGAVYDPSWWGSAMEDHVYDPFFTIGHEAAEKFVAGTELEVDDDRLLQLALGVAAGGVYLLSHRSDVIEERVTELVTRGKDEDWEAEKLAAQLGVEDGEIPGPVSEGIASTISIAATTNLTGAAADAVIEETKAVGLKTWVCIFHNSRESHMDADGQTVEVGEMFQVGESQGRFPGDPDLPVEEVANCNCYLSYEVVAPALEAQDEAIAASGPGEAATVARHRTRVAVQGAAAAVALQRGLGARSDLGVAPVAVLAGHVADGSVDARDARLDEIRAMVEALAVAVGVMALGGGGDVQAATVASSPTSRFGGPGSGPRPGFKKTHGSFARVMTNPKAAAKEISSRAPGKVAAAKAAADAYAEANPNWQADEISGAASLPTEHVAWLWPGAHNSLEKALDPDPRVVGAYKAQITKNVTRRLTEDGIGVNIAESGVESIETAADKVGAEPKIQTAMERWGVEPPNILVGGNTMDAGGRALWSGDIEVCAGEIEVYGNRASYEEQAAGRAPWGDSAGTDPKSGLEWQTQGVVGGGTFESTLRHETGHLVERGVIAKDPELHAEIRAEAARLLADPEAPLRGLSKYAAGQSYYQELTGRVAPEPVQKEAFAEAFATVTHPDFAIDQFQPELHPFLGLVEGLVT